jgi:MYXO-CTERM domain-containing protein
MSLQALAFQTITPLPDPQAWATLALGLGALGVFVRGRRRTERKAAAAA